MRRRWTVRVGVAVLSIGGLAALLQVVGYEPRLVPLVLLGAVGAAATWVVVDVLVDGGLDWNTESDSSAPGSGGDMRLWTYQRLLDGHVTAAAPDGKLRDKLAELTASTLWQRHHLRLHDPAAEARIDPELFALIAGDPRRLSLTDVDRLVRRIEEM